MAAGQLSFGEIARLDDNWWKSDPPHDPQDVWKTWDRDTYYLWGANSGNYQGKSMGELLTGSGLASVTGPSRGRAHPHYVGVITMAAGDLPKNDDVFQQLGALLANGKNVVVPTYQGKWSLGTGAGVSVPHWDEIQKYVLSHIVDLGRKASQVNIPAETYWPDYTTGHNGDQHPIAKLEDLEDIVNSVLSPIHGGKHQVVNAGANTGGFTPLLPKPKPVQVNGKHYTLVAFYYPDHPTAWDKEYLGEFMGNFYHPCTVTLDWPNPKTGNKIAPAPRFQTAEAAFQALKWWAHDAIRQDFESQTNGNDAYHLNSKKYGDPASSHYVAPDYSYANMGPVHSDEARNNAMELVVKQKFQGNAALLVALLATGDAYLLEHADNGHDQYWSDGQTGGGRNMLGRTLMKVRGKLGGAPAPPGTDDDNNPAVGDAVVAAFTRLV